jgi:hypothetical protein
VLRAVVFSITIESFQIVHRFSLRIQCTFRDMPCNRKSASTPEYCFTKLRIGNMVVLVPACIRESYSQPETAPFDNLIKMPMSDWA